MRRYFYSSGDTATCLYNAPHEDEALPRVLPGKLLSLDAQCRKDRGTSACFVSFALQRQSTCIFFYPLHRWRYVNETIISRFRKTTEFVLNYFALTLAQDIAWHIVQRLKVLLAETVR